MADNTLTLPGDIPGLLRRGSPVLFRDECSDWTVLCVDGDEVCAAPAGEVPLGLWEMSDDFALDLQDPTGRAHAAWFARDGFTDSEEDRLVRQSSRHARSCAMKGLDMTPRDIEILRHAVLHVAGRGVPDAR